MQAIKQSLKCPCLYKFFAAVALSHPPTVTNDV